MRRMLLELCLCAALVTGCYVGAYYDPYYYDAAYYAPYWFWYDGAFVYGWVDGNGVVHYVAALNSAGTDPSAQTGSEIDVNATAASIAAAADAYFQPAGCAHATASGATVTYAFDGCSGPQALHSITGRLTVTVSDGAGKLTLTSASDGLQVNGGDFVLDSVATVEDLGAERRVTLTSHSHSPGQADEREAQGTMTWAAGSGCITVDGQGAPQRGDLSASTALTGFQSCNGQCPTSGAITVTTREGTFRGTFDGSNSLTVTDPKGGTRVYSLQCQ